MALKLSTALRNAMLESGDLKHSMSNCVLKIYSGAQPLTADTAPSGTLLCTYSSSAGALTREVLPLGVVTLTSSGGSVDTFTVNSLEIMGAAVAYDTSVTVTAAAVVAAINNNPRNQLYTASNVLGVITISGKPGVGALLNGKAISVGTTTLVATVTSTTFGSGTGGGTAGVYALNGLQWGDSAAGVLVKHPTQTWSGAAVNTGTAGWGRFEAAVTDGLATDSSEAVYRIDGDAGISGAVFNLGALSFTSGVTYVMQSFSLTLPTA